MAKALITTRFPTTSEVARKLGVPDSRVRRVRDLMNLGAAGGGVNGVQVRKKVVARAGTRKSNPNTR
jgi:hypothetical protein